MLSDPDPSAIASAQSWWHRAENVLAAGTWRVGNGAYTYPPGIFPVMAERGEGAHLIDTAGNDYVDWIMGWGPVILGYRDPDVERALHAQVERGPLFSLLHSKEVELAERLRDRIPCAEGVAFGKNGSDVLGVAVRIARATTGRERVLVHGYHGFHDWYLASLDHVEGIPAALRATVERFPYGDLDCLEQQLAGPEPVAAIVMEPAHYREPAPGYLEGVRRLADRSGALLVFDEVVTALRLAPGGAQEAYGVIPDLACLGKSLANGMPLSALCGPAKHLRVIARVQYGMTFRGETLSFAAAHATLDVLDRDKVHLHLAEIGRRLIDGFAERARSACVEARLTGFPARTTLAFAPSGRLSALGLLTLFLQGCLERGVLCNGNFLPSRAHGDEELAITFAAFDHSLDLVRAAAAADSFDGLARFDQRPEFFQPATRRPC